MAPGTDTGQAFNYLGFGETAGWIIAVISILVMLMIGSLFSKLLLQLAPPGLAIENARVRFGYLARVALLASIIGIFLIIPFRIMPWDRAMAPVLVTLFTIPMVFANAWRIKPVVPINSDINKKIFLIPIILLVIVLLIFQLVLAKGVEV
jgi:hypothetical protein